MWSCSVRVSEEERIEWKPKVDREEVAGGGKHVQGGISYWVVLVLVSATTWNTGGRAATERQKKKMNI